MLSSRADGARSIGWSPPSAPPAESGRLLNRVGTDAEALRARCPWSQDGRGGGAANRRRVPLVVAVTRPGVLPLRLNGLPRASGVDPSLRHASREVVAGAVVLLQAVQLGVRDDAQRRQVWQIGDEIAYLTVGQRAVSGGRQRPSKGAAETASSTARADSTASAKCVIQ